MNLIESIAVVSFCTIACVGLIYQQFTGALNERNHIRSRIRN